MGAHFCFQGAVRPTHYVVRCKRCQRHIPSGQAYFPKGNIVVECMLCGEKRRYRPSEVFLGFPDSLIDRTATGSRAIL